MKENIKSLAIVMLVGLLFITGISNSTAYAKPTTFNVTPGEDIVEVYKPNGKMVGGIVQSYEETGDGMVNVTIAGQPYHVSIDNIVVYDME